MLPAKDRDRGRPQGEELAGGWRQAEPSSGEDAQQVSVRKDKDVAGGRPRPADDPVGAQRYLVFETPSGHGPRQMVQPG